MKILARIPSFLLTPKDTQYLRLQNQAYLLIIPKKLLDTAAALTSAELSFDLVIENGIVSLLGHTTATRETAPTAKEVAT